MRAFAFTFMLLGLSAAVASAATTIDSGSTVVVHLSSPDIRTNKNQVGDAFHAHVTAPYATKYLRGAVVYGHVSEIQSAGQGRTAHLQLALDAWSIRTARARRSPRIRRASRRSRTIRPHVRRSAQVPVPRSEVRRWAASSGARSDASWAWSAGPRAATPTRKQPSEFRRANGRANDVRHARHGARSAPSSAEYVGAFARRGPRLGTPLGEAYRRSLAPFVSGEVHYASWLDSRRFVASVLAAALLAAVAAGPRAAYAAGPTVAVLNFNTQGLTSDWYGNFEPGIALSDLVTDQLVNGGKFNVVDRKHMADIMQEHQLSSGGEVSPATLVQSGRLTGARYLITGNILQLDKTGGSGGGGGAGGLMGGVIGGALGGIHTERVTLKVSVRIIDAVSGTILQSFNDEQTKGGTSWGGGAGAGSWNAFGVGGYSNEQFTSSTMGHLINDEAAIIVSKIDPTKFAAESASGPAVHGRILTIDGNDIVINAGSDAGLTEGMMMDAISVKQIKDPDSGKMITTEIPKGVIQIVSVTKGSAIAKRVSGSVKPLEIVRSQ